MGEYVIYHADKEIEQNNVLAVDGNKWIYDIDLVETEEENIYRPKTTVRFDGSDCYANGVKVDYYRRPKVFEVIGVLRMHVPRYVTLTSGEGLPEGMDEDVARDMARSLENDVSAELAYILELSGGLLNCHINVSGDKLSDIYLWFDAKEGRVEYNYRFQNWGEVIVYQDRYELR